LHPIEDLKQRGNRQQVKRDLDETTIGRGVDIDIDPGDRAWDGARTTAIIAM
jgi:hypothetical protein